MFSRSSQVVVACVASRFGAAVFFPLLQQQLDRSVEFSTPVTSYRSLQEGVFLAQRELPVYDGGVVHQAPLLVAAMAWVSGETLRALAYACVDAMIAHQLMVAARVLRKRAGGVSAAGIPANAALPQPWIVGALYVLNPLVLLSTLSRSTLVFTHLAVATAAVAAVQGRSAWAGAGVAAAAYLSLYPLLLVVPIAAILPNKRCATVCTAACIATLLLLLVSSYRVSHDSWQYVYSTYGVVATFGKLVPNLGLWWYFFVELFEMFVPFFKAVFNLFVVACILPFSLRFYKQPFYAFVLCIAWIALTKPYPTLGDAGFVLSFLPFFQPLFGYFRYSVVTALLLVHAIVLSPIFYHLWVDLGSGNSNFFYAISLVYALALASMLVDLVWAMLRTEYDAGKPNLTLKMTPV
ncbi:LAMI_0E05182g1_1 [Lachancea mirantina]|uniref:LAMI_0E05182g1_1 n=1 Tax=Lachancea mirantina TaxID=1230905 RepID=A0A1G4JLM5_9SACH|nr:LAMI_0E05182g1_1 [Lachancea mirantina]